MTVLTPIKRMLRLVFDPETRAASRRAKQHVQERHLEWVVRGVSLRAVEPARFVFAVFYSVGVPRRPAPYVLAFVNRNTLTIEEANPSPDSEYWIRGRK